MTAPREPRRHFRLRRSRRRALYAACLAVVAAPLAWASRFGPRPADAFSAQATDEMFRALFGERTITPSNEIRIVAADLAENGAVVPLKIDTDLAPVRCVTVVATKNPVPLVAQFVTGERVSGPIATRVKLAESCEVVAVVETDTGLYRAQKHIEVTIGGCGV